MLKSSSLQYLQPVPEDLLCLFCKDALRDPVSHSSCSRSVADLCLHTRCGNMFCKACVLKWKEKNLLCKFCEGILENHLVAVETRSLLERLNSLLVQCAFCSTAMKRNEEHCLNCNQHILQSLHNDHTSKCTVGCPKGCGQNLTSANRQHHLESECESLRKRKRTGTSDEREESETFLMDKKVSQVNQRITVLQDEVVKLKQMLSEDWSKAFVIQLEIPSFATQDKSLRTSSISIGNHQFVLEFFPVSPWDRTRVALQLERDDSSGPDCILINYRYRILNRLPGGDPLKHELMDTSFTKKGTKTALQAMPRFVSREMILTQNSPYLKEGMLTVICEILLRGASFRLEPK